MIEHFMLANSSSPKIASFINFENSAKSLYGFNGIVAESQMMESRNHSLFDKKKSNLSPAPTDGVSADKKQTNQQKSFHDESGGTNQFKESGLTGF